jgi:hypothetical protein
VTEIPPVKPVVTEYQWHRLVCPACGEETRADVPAGVPTGGFGPRVQAIMALWLSLAPNSQLVTHFFRKGEGATFVYIDDIFHIISISHFQLYASCV